jgi:hypothetical protein
VDAQLQLNFRSQRILGNALLGAMLAMAAFAKQTQAPPTRILPQALRTDLGERFPWNRIASFLR